MDKGIIVASKFSVLFSVGSALAIDAVFPRGQLDTDFLSASGLPADYTMTWNFVLPPKHNFTVDFVKYNIPACQSKTVKVIYKQDNMAAVEKTLSENQPTNYLGNFSLSLSNCAVRSAGGPGLFLHFRVSVFRGGFPGRKIFFMCEHKLLFKVIELFRINICASGSVFCRLDIWYKYVVV